MKPDEPNHPYGLRVLSGMAPIVLELTVSILLCKLHWCVGLHHHNWVELENTVRACNIPTLSCCDCRVSYQTDCNRMMSEWQARQQTPDSDKDWSLVLVRLVHFDLRHKNRPLGISDWPYLERKEHGPGVWHWLSYMNQSTGLCFVNRSNCHSLEEVKKGLLTKPSLDCLESAWR